MKNNPHDLQQPYLDSNVKQDLHNVAESGILNYRSEALPTWCPGCGYYGITHGLTQALNRMKVPNEKMVCVSGIGCAGRYPFFLKGYGLHSIHGRALPVACGIKMANDDLTVLAVGGDGDGFGIGGGHVIHAMRRNVNITYVLFDNSIYGLTKGQSSPTTPQGQITGTAPYGHSEMPLNPLILALSYQCTFVASGYAGLPSELSDIFLRALSHNGFSFVAVTTPCITFDHANITYQRMRNEFKPVPPGHDASSRTAAVGLIMEHQRYSGVILEENRPTWRDLQNEIIQKAQAMPNT